MTKRTRIKGGLDNFVRVDSGACHDLSLRQLNAAAARHGWKPEGWGGYYRREHADGKGARCVSVLNAGERRRDQLAYLIAAAEDMDREGEVRS
jgi:hypothetical protein